MLPVESGHRASEVVGAAYEGTMLYWMFKDGALVECDPRDAPQCLSPENAVTLIDQASAYSDVVLYAAVERSIYDESRVGWLQISSTDLALKLAADAADDAGLRPALDKAVSTSVDNAVLPALWEPSVVGPLSGVPMIPRPPVAEPASLRTIR